MLCCPVFVLGAPVPQDKPLDPIDRSELCLFFSTRAYQKADGNWYAESLVLEIIDKTDAQKYGLKSGDILRKVGNDKIQEVIEYNRNVAMYRPGAIIDLTVERDGKLMIIKVKIGGYKVQEIYVSLPQEN